MTNTVWKKHKLIDVCDSIVDCVNKTAPVVDESTPYKMIRTTNVMDGYVNVTSVRHVSAMTYEKWTRRQVPRVGDVLLTREAPLGRVGKIRTPEKVFLGQRLMSYRANPELLDENFLLYSLMSNDLQGQIRGLGSGSTVEHMRVGDGEDLVISMPTIDIQRTIGSTLANYDELIENNLRRMSILEEAAGLLYEAYFTSSLSKDWQRKPLTACIELNPTVKVNKDGVKPFVPMASMRNNSMIIDSFAQKSGNSGSKFEVGDTLFARITPCLENGKTGFVHYLPNDHTAGFGSTEYIVMRSKTLSPEIVYLTARSEPVRSTAIKSMTGASGRQRVQEKCFDSFMIPQPPVEIVEELTAQLRPLFDQVYSLHLKNMTLTEIRNLLLPRLLSGEAAL